jgi:hypothetical protein
MDNYQLPCKRSPCQRAVRGIPMKILISIVLWQLAFYVAPGFIPDTLPFVWAQQAELLSSHPQLTEGDQWLERVSVNDQTYQINYEVTGERMVDAVPCNTLKASFDPPLMSVYDKGSIMLNKQLFMPKVMLLWNSEMKAAMNIEFRYQYEFDPEPLYPLNIGKEVTATEVKTTYLAVSDGKTKMDESREVRYVVEAKEAIEVPAGTFDCYRVVEYDTIGRAMRTFWMAYETKFFEVKAINHESGELTELMNYQVTF